MEFQDLLNTTHSMHRKLAMRMITDTGLTPGQPKILNYLYTHDGSSQTEIATACYIETASLTSVLNGMEAKGLVERRRQNGNRRTYYIYLTGKGKDMCRIIDNAFQEINEKLFSDIPSGDVAVFMDVFEKIYGLLAMMLREG
ncbi:MAG: MarR family transcriptional regulator [Clostridiales bacterium]|nr:MarR family transcriptional regulator [Clostridiales bacterium]MCD8370090.1 MarR family transcriptional regulator [Clostridiales bacterium]